MNIKRSTGNRLNIKISEITTLERSVDEFFAGIAASQLLNGILPREDDNPSNTPCKPCSFRKLELDL